MCVCVVIQFVLDVRFVDAPAGVRHNFSTILSIEGFSHPFPSSTVKSNFVYLVRKNPRSCYCDEIRTLVPTSEGFEVTN